MYKLSELLLTGAAEVALPASLHTASVLIASEWSRANILPYLTCISRQRFGCIRPNPSSGLIVYIVLPHSQDEP